MNDIKRYANTPVTLSLDPHKEVVSQPYIDMTVSLMRDFGVNVEVSADKRTYTIPKVSIDSIFI